MKLMRMLFTIVLAVAAAAASYAASYTWTDENGNLHATDQLDKVPLRFQQILKHDAERYVDPSGIGFERDRKGNYTFFDHSSPARQAVTRKPPPELSGPPGSFVTERQLAEIKRRYIQSGVEPRPEVLSGRVKRIISGDTFELENGRKVTFIGITFPEELKGETEIHKEAKEYQEKLMKGKTVHLLFGPRKVDEKGRLLAYVYLGTDVFVNAELVMNGYARVQTVPPNTDYHKLFLRLEEFARKSMLGMWDRGGE